MIEVGISLPKSINDIKLRDYQGYMKVYEANKEVDDANFLELKLLEAFCEIDLLTANQMPFETFDFALEHMSNVFKQKTPLVRRFKMKGTDGVTAEFGFIPNLSKMSLGEYVDLDTYISDMENMHKAMAVLYRPVHNSWEGKEHYRIAEYEGTEKYAEVMKEMPLGIALGAMVFFYRLGMKLSKHMMDYSLQVLETQELSEEQSQRLQRDMDGIKASMHLLEGMPFDLEALPIYKYTRR
jgi:hypothetical protein